MANLVYGASFSLQNYWNDLGGGFLDTRGYCRDFRPRIGNHLCVSTATVADRDAGSGTWRILSAEGKADGSPVVAGDRVHLLNGWNSFRGGFLDTRGYGKDFEPTIGNYLCVTTATSKERDGGSGTWIIQPASGDTGVAEGAPMMLLNAWNHDRGGYLDTRGYIRDFAPQIGNHLCVSTALSNNRDSGSGHWRFQGV